PASPPALVLPRIDEVDIAPARALQVQLRTRITTQPLHDRSGDEATAARSVSGLFELTRQLVSANPRANAFYVAADFLLNQIVRSLSARWHGWMVGDDFPDTGRRRQFRYELTQLQAKLNQFVGLLDEI